MKLLTKNKLIVLLILLLLAAVVLFVFLNNVFFERTIDNKLYRIAHPVGDAVSQSSFVLTYIYADKEDYSYIVAHGDRSLNYMLKKFSRNDDNGLIQYIMALACSEIIEKEKGYDSQDWMSGRDWYNNYIKHKDKN
jgi:uncharacterized membrane protein (DUF485 family)